MRNREEMESAPEDRSEVRPAIPFAEFLARAEWPVLVAGKGMLGPAEAVAWASQCGLDPLTGRHKASMEGGGAILFREKASGEPIAAYWD